MTKESKHIDPFTPNELTPRQYAYLIIYNRRFNKLLSISHDPWEASKLAHEEAMAEIAKPDNLELESTYNLDFSTE